MTKTAAEEPLIGALSAGWYFGSVAMLTFGLVVLLSGLRLRSGDRSGVAHVLVISIAYLLFGLAAFILHKFNPHFLLFVLTGLLCGVPVVGLHRRPT